MSIETKRPMIKETVGALYYAFNKMLENGEFDIENYNTTVKSEVVKQIGTNENSNSTVVKASGKDYVTASQTSNVEQAVEVIAFDPEDIAKARGDKIGKYGVKSGAPTQRPYFAFGKVKKMLGGAVEYVWYPKCQLAENTDDIGTSEDTFSEQNDTLTIRAYSYDKEGNKSYRINSEMKNFPVGITEELFFNQVVTSDEDIEKILATLNTDEGNTDNNENQENVQGA